MTPPEGRIFLSLRKLEELRTAHRVFDGKADVWLVVTGDNSVLGIGRYYQGEKLIGLFNFAETTKTLSLREDGSFCDLLNGEAVDKTSLILQPGGFLWLQCDFDDIKETES